MSTPKRAKPNTSNSNSNAQAPKTSAAQIRGRLQLLKMITGADFYHVMTAMVPLYVAMILAYGSVKWCRIFSPDRCSGINSFVALSAMLLLSFHFISSNDPLPFTMNLRFIAADRLQKLMVLLLLTA